MKSGIFHNKIFKIALPLVVMLLIFWQLGFFRVLMERPNGYHQWSQCMRASIALNYAEEDMNFFKPRVHECRNTDGVTGCEFPVMNYLAAICYKVFGFNELWYRLLMLLTMVAGLWAAYRMSLWYNGIWVSLSITVMWFCSPVLNYYTPSFIPEVASVGLAMCSWYFFFSYLRNPSRKALIGTLVLVTLAGLIKVPSAVHIIAMGAIVVLDRMRWFKTADSKHIITNYWHWLGGLTASLVLIYGWYAYAIELNSINNINWFILKTRPIASTEQFKESIELISWLWWPYYYHGPLMSLFMFAFVVILVFAKKVDRLLLTVTLLLVIGLLGYAALNIRGFNNHDYYVIPLLPAFFFVLLTFSHLLTQAFQQVPQRYLVFLFLSYYAYDAFVYSVEHQESRYYGEHSETTFDNSAYYELEPHLRSLGIERSDKVVSLFEVSPIVTLYLMDQKGYAADRERDRGFIKEAIEDSKYIMLNDPSFIGLYKELDPFFEDKISTYKGIEIYKVPGHILR